MHRAINNASRPARLTPQEWTLAQPRNPRLLSGFGGTLVYAKYRYLLRSPHRATTAGGRVERAADRHNLSDNQEQIGSRLILHADVYLGKPNAVRWLSGRKRRFAKPL